jgi:hypothetical protein
MSNSKINKQRRSKEEKKFPGIEMKPTEHLISKVTIWIILHKLKGGLLKCRRLSFLKMEARMQAPLTL